MTKEQLEKYRRGILNLVTTAGTSHVRVPEVRELHQRLVDNMSNPAAEASPAQAAMRAEVLDELNRVSLDLTGRSFETMCGIPTDLEPAMADTEAPNTFDAYVAWIKPILLTDKLKIPAAQKFVYTRTMHLLKSLDITEKGKLVQFLYDAGLISQESSLISLAEVNLTSINLVEANLVGANLVEANLQGANLTGANLSRAALIRANLVGAKLGWSLLIKANMLGVEMGGATLAGAELRGANLHSAHLGMANMRRASLEAVNLEKANLLGVHLESALLTGANLTDANLLWTNFSGARLDMVILTGATYNQHTQWPEDIDPAEKGAVRID
ncbi:MAG: pentapeptide repeat-containing protein [Anaerolineae bacterium]|nr:pentapeptide repeat-containing protein [Anaerolineae bacterium]